MKHHHQRSHSTAANVFFGTGLARATKTVEFIKALPHDRCSRRRRHRSKPGQKPQQQQQQNATATEGAPWQQRQR